MHSEISHNTSIGLVLGGKMPPVKFFQFLAKVPPLQLLLGFLPVFPGIIKGSMKYSYLINHVPTSKNSSSPIGKFITSNLQPESRIRVLKYPKKLEVR